MTTVNAMRPPAERDATIVPIESVQAQAEPSKFADQVQTVEYAAPDEETVAVFANEICRHYAVSTSPSFAHHDIVSGLAEMLEVIAASKASAMNRKTA